MLISSALAVSLSLLAQNWSVGVEREVSAGTYMQIVSAQHGWRVWRIETRSGVQCKAFKSSQGRPHPVPVGVGSMMDRRGTPFLEVFFSDVTEKFYSEWHAVHYRGRAKYRSLGARFWEEGALDPTSATEEVVEVIMTSWEYPEILVGHAEERARMDLTGLRWAVEQVKSCQSDAQTQP